MTKKKWNQMFCLLNKLSILWWTTLTWDVVSSNDILKMFSGCLMINGWSTSSCMVELNSTYDLYIGLWIIQQLNVIFTCYFQMCYMNVYFFFISKARDPFFLLWWCSSLVPFLCVKKEKKKVVPNVVWFSLSIFSGAIVEICFPHALRLGGENCYFYIRWEPLFFFMG